MANIFKKITSREVGTTNVKIGDYDVPAATTATLIGMTVANITANTVDASVFVYDNTGNSTFIVANSPIPPGSTLVVIGGDQKVVLEAEDSIYVVSSADDSLDVLISVLEMN